MKKYKSEYIKPSKDDIYLYNEGKNYKSYNLFGSKLVEDKDKKGVQFNVWAPNAKEVRVVGNFNGWDGHKHVMKQVKKTGVWSLFINDLEEWEVYKYEVKKSDGSRVLKADPFAVYSEKRPNNASVVYEIDGFEWTDKTWMEERDHKNVYNSPVNIYEIHMGSWMKDVNDREHFLNYTEIADRIIPHLKELNYNYVEIMPITEHPLDDSWGYQTTGYFSPSSRYGTPKEFMGFIDKLHNAGIGVIMDWVPGHFCKDEHGLCRFDGTYLYEYSNVFKRRNDGWGTSNFDYSKNQVKSFLISSAVYFFEKFHIDGIRVDAVANMIYLDYGRKEGRWEPNEYGGNENIEAIEFLRKMNSVLFKYYKNIMMIAEESTSWPLVTAPAYLGGLGFNYKWNMGWMNDILKYMEMDPIHRKWYHNLITFSFTYAFSENFVLSISHDEVVHGKKSLLDKMPGNYNDKFSNLRLLYSYMVAHPGKKLLFMGGEFGQFVEWRFYEGLEWFLLGYENHRKLFDYTKKLNKFYMDEKCFYDDDHKYSGFEWIDPNNYEQSIAVFMRKSLDGDFIICIFNFTPIEHEYYRIGVPVHGEYEEVFNSDDIEYGGRGFVNQGRIESQKLQWQSQKYSMKIKVPPLGGAFFKLKKRYLNLKMYKNGQKHYRQKGCLDEKK